MSNIIPLPTSKLPLETGGGNGDSGGMPPDLPTRVAVLEQIAKSTEASLGEIKADLRAMRGDLNGKIDKVDDRMRAETRWLLVTMFAGFASLVGIMAKGFKWL